LDEFDESTVWISEVDKSGAFPCDGASDRCHFPDWVVSRCGQSLQHLGDVPDAKGDMRAARAVRALRDGVIASGDILNQLEDPAVPRVEVCGSNSCPGNSHDLTDVLVAAADLDDTEAQ